MPKEEPKRGAISLLVVVPPEAPDLWPLQQGWRIVVTRAKDIAGSGAQIALDTDNPDPKPRIEPFEGEVTALTIVLQDDTGALRAKATTPPSFIDPTALDRELYAFLAPVGGAAAVVTVVGAAGKAVSHPGRLGAAVVVSSGGEVFLTGGAEYVGGGPCDLAAAGAPVADVFRFDTADFTVAKVGSMSTPRSFHTASSLPDGSVALVGGYVAVGRAAAVTTATVDLLQANQGTLKAAPNPLAKARSRHCAVSVNGRVFVAGGEGPGAATVELWDPGVGTLTTGNMLQPRRDHSCALITDPVTETKQVWIIGGTRSGGGGIQTIVDRIEVWSVDGAKLVNEGIVVQPAGEISMAATAVITSPRGMVIAGGFGAGGTSDPKSNVWWHALPGVKWQAGASLSSARGCAATALVGSRALLFGGMKGDGQPAATADVVELNAVAPKLAATRSLPSPRAGAVATVLANGAVLLSGGVKLQDEKLIAEDRLFWMWP